MSSPALGPAPCRAHRGFTSTPGRLGHSKPRGKRSKGCPDQQKTTQQSCSPRGPSGPTQGRCHHHSAGTWEIPLKTETRNKVRIYFYKEKKETKRF